MGGELGQPFQTAVDAGKLDILFPELQVHPGKGVEQQRCDGVAAEKGDAPVVAEQGLGQRIRPLLRRLLRLAL